MAQDPAFLVYYKDILVSCADWDADVLGWYFRLLSHQADKQGGLSPLIENLALLAGVKFSQFDRFKRCWEENLSKKFEQNETGLLVNVVQEGHLNERRGYKEKQAIRGLVGYYIKKIRKEGNLSEEHIKNITPLLFKTLSTENSKAENEHRFKRTLEAYIGDVNANAIGNTDNKKDRGMGKDNPMPRNPSPKEDTLIWDMLQVWMEFYPEYVQVSEDDLPALLDISNFIFKAAGVPRGKVGQTEREQCVGTWRIIAEKIIEDDFWKHKPLKTICKNLQEFYSKIKNPSQNGKSKNGNQHSFNLQSVNDKINRLFDEHGGS